MLSLKRFGRANNFLRCVPAVVAVLALAACGGGNAPQADLTPEQLELKQRIEARRLNFQDLGAAFKAIGDELRAGRPGSPTLQFSLDSVARYTREVPSWFPDGSGPDSGFRTDALQVIWTEPEAFAAVMKEYEEGVALLVEAGQAGDQSVLQMRFEAVAATCASCHDKYRKK